MTKSSKPAPTRKEQLIKALGAKRAPTVAGLADRFGLQPHSVRASISGLRKAGYAIDTVPSASGGPSTYRLAPESPSPEATDAGGAT